MKHMAINKVIKIIKKYSGYFWQVFKVTLNKDLQFRSNFIGYFALTLIWFIQAYLLTFVITDRFPSIAGWNGREIFVLTSTWGFINGLTHFAFVGLFSLPYSINNGGLDQLLLKPINSIIIACSNLFGIPNLLNAFCYGAVLLFITPKTNLINIAGFLILSFIGVLLQFFIWLAIVTTTFHAGKLDGTFDLFAILKLAGKYPSQAYSHLNILIRICLLPLVLFATIPASALIGKLDFTQIGLLVLVTTIVGIGSVCYWKFSISKYTSASS
jgi:ABC-2 type transport system permease protein